MKHHDDLRRVREQDPYFAGTLAKGLLILQAFVGDPRPHANSELAAKLGLSRPTVSRLCRTLQTLGFLDHDERLDRYFIGPAAMALGYPYAINLPQLGALRPAMQELADRIEGAVSVGVTLGLDVIYVETSTHEQGTLMRPGMGAVRSVVATAMGRAWLAQLRAPERQSFMARVRRERPAEYARCAEAVRESVSQYAHRGFAINLGDAGLNVLAVGVAARLRHGPRQLLFNGAVSGLRTKKARLLDSVGPALVQLVQAADRHSGLQLY
ncbi:helix-turn-helix domain-containing protein [Xenophilus arseniciresistens]|uniref:Helix-turn-helix domain-containing protein n=1 Tax=Xenophilus arseniciresistens TaxID=1283306 RepID=A0AAE3N6N7_9BURK|nr:helix-turn-helix domain-containing protein [Xenophilus arseniciresistens]MDA7414927.1 helix-turn-helix domain-containing protein [Xenophilus arseniciresistens]